MKQLVKQIRETFFNPVLYFLPTFVFMLVNEFFGVKLAWEASFPVAFLLVFYIYFIYKRVFLWHGVFATVYLIIGLASSIIPKSNFIFQQIDEVLLILFLLFVVFQKDSLSKIAIKTVSHKLPMTNNEVELKRNSISIIFIVSVYLLSLIGVYLFAGEEAIREKYLYYLRLAFAFAIITYAFVQTFRVLFVRHRLAGEDWLPVVDNSGQVIGSVSYQPDSAGGERLMNPVVRLYFIEDNKLLLQRRSAEDRSEPNLWDASVSRKVRLSASVESTVKEKTEELYGIEPENLLFLTNYIYYGEFCDNYIYLFVTCRTEGIDPNPDKLYASKWWTLRQIEENLGGGVFSERFETEFQILKRSGLLDGEVFCDCDCKLRNVIISASDNKNSIQGNE